jgi:hypothetical protein
MIFFRAESKERTYTRPSRSTFMLCTSCIQKSVWRACSYISNRRVILPFRASRKFQAWRYEPLTFSREQGGAHPLISLILPYTLGQAYSSLVVRCQYRNEPWRGEEARRWIRRNLNNCVQQWTNSVWALREWLLRCWIPSVTTDLCRNSSYLKIGHDLLLSFPIQHSTIPHSRARLHNFCSWSIVIEI